MEFNKFLEENRKSIESEFDLVKLTVCWFLNFKNFKFLTAENEVLARGKKRDFRTPGVQWEYMGVQWEYMGVPWE